MSTKLIIPALILLLVYGMGCGGGSSTVTPPTPKTGNVTGTVYAPNGLDPVSGALIYVVEKSGSATGDPPTEAYEAYDYSDPDGTFQLTDVPTGDQTIKIIKGAFTKQLAYTVQEGSNALTAADTTLPSSSGGGDIVEKMAVVTGDYDKIENVLAKLGLGDVNASGSLILGTETFQLVDGNFTLDDATYPDFMDFFGDPANYADFRTIFFNCGNGYESEFFTDPNAATNLKSWISDGGRLYATDWSYDYVEQLFPKSIDFYGTDPGLSSTPEARDAAEAGDSFDTTNATVLDAGMLAWLQAIGATNVDDTVIVEGWLSAWVPIDDINTGVKSWAKALVWADGTESSRDITLTFGHGSGTIFFSSYHTENFTTADLTPQDRILQYLIFEVL